MDISAKIEGIKYKPFICRRLETFDLDDLENAIFSCTSFILNIDKENKVAVSWWLSPKRSRSYPYSRVYDTLNFFGKKITIIPIIKDEGAVGDKDFLQWDTISLMSLLGVYAIIVWYVAAEPSSKDKYKTTKIAEQKFDIQYIKQEIRKLLSYQSDALHWNLSQIDKVGEIGERALKSYEKISKELKIKLHSKSFSEKRIKELLKGKDEFMKISRDLAKKAQRRESLTIQPKEKLTGKKAIITIKNYLGGYYFFTVDEIEIKNKNIYLIEGKHTKQYNFPSLGDIKDGLVKMILFTNLEYVKIGDKNYNPKPILKLTVKSHFLEKNLSVSQKKILSLLGKEAKTNNFEIFLS